MRQPADRASVRAFLKVQSPAIVVHEVTAHNRGTLHHQYGPHFGDGDIVWEIRRTRTTAPEMIGVLHASPERTQANEGHTRTPLDIEILERLPVGTSIARWRSELMGTAVVDDHGSVSLLTNAGTRESIVAPR